MGETIARASNRFEDRKEVFARSQIPARKQEQALKNALRVEKERRKLLTTTTLDSGDQEKALRLGLTPAEAVLADIRDIPFDAVNRVKYRTVKGSGEVFEPQTIEEANWIVEGAEGYERRAVRLKLTPETALEAISLGLSPEEASWALIKNRDLRRVAEGKDLQEQKIAEKNAERKAQKIRLRLTDEEIYAASRRYIPEQLGEMLRVGLTPKQEEEVRRCMEVAKEPAEEAKGLGLTAKEAEEAKRLGLTAKEAEEAKRLGRKLEHVVVAKRVLGLTAEQLLAVMKVGFSLEQKVAGLSIGLVPLQVRELEEFREKERKEAAEVSLQQKIDVFVKRGYSPRQLEKMLELGLTSTQKEALKEKGLGGASKEEAEKLSPADLALAKQLELSPEDLALAKYLELSPADLALAKHFELTPEAAVVSKRVGLTMRQLAIVGKGMFSVEQIVAGLSIGLSKHQKEELKKINEEAEAARKDKEQIANAAGGATTDQDANIRKAKTDEKAPAADALKEAPGSLDIKVDDSTAKIRDDEDGEKVEIADKEDKVAISKNRLSKWMSKTFRGLRRKPGKSLPVGDGTDIDNGRNKGKEPEQDYLERPSVPKSPEGRDFEKKPDINDPFFDDLYTGKETDDVAKARMLFINNVEIDLKGKKPQKEVSSDAMHMLSYYFFETYIRDNKRIVGLDSLYYEVWRHNIDEVLKVVDRVNSKEKKSLDEWEQARKEEIDAAKSQREHKGEETLSKYQKVLLKIPIPGLPGYVDLNNVAGPGSVGSSVLDFTIDPEQRFNGDRTPSVGRASLVSNDSSASSIYDDHK